MLAMICAPATSELNPLFQSDSGFLLPKTQLPRAPLTDGESTTILVP